MASLLLYAVELLPVLVDLEVVQCKRVAVSASKEREIRPSDVYPLESMAVGIHRAVKFEEGVGGSDFAWKNSGGIPRVGKGHAGR